MKKADKIHKLVKSLTGTEKRYFKIFTSKHIIGEKNHYATLFDIIEEQKEFDNKKIKDAFIKKTKSKNYTEIKYYTYKMILKSLSEYHHKSSVSAQLKEFLHQAEILVNKELFEEAAQILSTAKKLAIKNEQLSQLHQILVSELDLLTNYPTHVNVYHKSNKILSDLNELLNKQKNINQYKSILIKINHLIVTKGLNSIDTLMLKECNQIMQQLKKLDLKKLDLNTEKRLVLSSLTNLNILLKNWDDAYHYSRKRIELLGDANTDTIKLFISYLGRHILICSVLNKIDEINKTVLKIEAFHKKHSSEITLKQEAVIFSYTFRINIALIEKATSDKKIENILYDIDSNLKKYEKVLANYYKIGICTEVVATLFKKGKYTLALDWVNKSLEMTDKKSKSDYIQLTIRMLNIIIHFELKNDILLESILRSTYLFLKKGKALTDFEKYVLTFLRKAIKTPSRADLKLELRNLGTDLSKLLNDPILANNELYILIIDWLKTKVLLNANYKD